jgi:hypothetical protein
MSTAFVYIVHHVRKSSGSDEDTKLIGVYSTQLRARHAVDRLQLAEGFKSTPHGFAISCYEVDKDHWTEGFLTE